VKLNGRRVMTRHGVSDRSAPPVSAAARSRIARGAEETGHVSNNLPCHLVRLQVRIETIAENGLSLEDTLAALTPKGRCHVTRLLERTRACSEPDEQAAAAQIRQLAERIWPHRTGG
jgi:hypothetical protein